MKLPVLFASLMTLTLGAQAQQAYKFKAPGQHYSPYVRQALTKHLSTAQKTTAAHERLTGFSVYVFNGTSLGLQDSANFQYSKARGINFNPNSMFLDEDNIMFDSATYFNDFGSGIEFDRAHKTSFDNNDERISVVELRQGSTSSRENFRDRRFSYDVNGNIAIAYVLGWNTSTNKWDTLTRRHYAYNSQNQVIADSIYVYSSANFMSKNEYSLDGNGNQLEILLSQRQGGNWLPQFLEKHTYDALNNLTTNTGLSYDISISDWVENSFDTFAYNNNHVYHFTENRTWNTSTNSWENTSRELRTLNAAADRVVVQDMKNWDPVTNTWEDEVVIEWTYTPMGHPALGIITMDFGGPMEVGNIHSFYEQYHDLNVTDAKAAAIALTLFPNPASSTLHLKCPQPLKGAKISLTNMAGQQVYQTNQELNGSSASLEIAHLPAGTYLLSMHENGSVLATKTVVKN